MSEQTKRPRIEVDEAVAENCRAFVEALSAWVERIQDVASTWIDVMGAWASALKPVVAALWPIGRLWCAQQSAEKLVRRKPQPHPMRTRPVLASRIGRYTRR